MAVIIDQTKCAKDHACPCVAQCPMSALSQKDEKSAPVVDPAKCVECGMCTQICPNGAIKLDH